MTRDQIEKELRESLMSAFKGKTTSKSTLKAVKKHVQKFVDEKLGPPPEPKIEVTIQGNVINIKVEG